MIRVESRQPNPFVIAWTLAAMMPACDDIMRLVLAWAHARCPRYPSVKRMFCTHCLRTDGAYMMGKPFEVRDANGYLLDGSCYTIGKSGAVVYAPPAPIKFRIEPKEPAVPMYRKPPVERLIYRTQLDDTARMVPISRGSRDRGIRRSSQPNPQPSTRMVWRGGNWQKG